MDTAKSTYNRETRKWTLAIPVRLERERDTPLPAREVGLKGRQSSERSSFERLPPGDQGVEHSYAVSRERSMSCEPIAAQHKGRVACQDTSAVWPSSSTSVSCVLSSVREQSWGDGRGMKSEYWCQSHCRRWKGGAGMMQEKYWMSATVQQQLRQLRQLRQ